MTKVLVVFQAIPEETMQYIVEADEAGLKDLKLSHNNYTGLVDAEEEDINKALVRVGMRLSSAADASDSDLEWAELDKDQLNVWAKGKVLGADPVDVVKEGIELVILTGYMM